MDFQRQNLSFNFNYLRILSIKIEALEFIRTYLAGRFQFQTEEFEIFDFISSSHQNLIISKDDEESVNDILFDLFCNEDERITLNSKLEEIANNIYKIDMAFEEGDSSFGNFNFNWDIIYFEPELITRRVNLQTVFENLNSKMNEFLDSQKLIYQQLINKRIKYVEKFQSEIAGIQEFAEKLIDNNVFDYEIQEALENIIEMGDKYIEKPFIDRNKTEDIFNRFFSNYSENDKIEIKKYFNETISYFNLDTSN